MRHFLVLGYTTNSKDEVGQNLYLGSDREEAATITKDSAGAFARKEMHELTNPLMRKHYDDNEANRV